MFSQVFYRHGKFCASHPWEVIVIFLTMTICMASMGTYVNGSVKICGYKCLEDNKGMEMAVMIVMRCAAILYGYHQFWKLYKLGSTYLVGIAGLFSGFSSFMFCASATNFLNGDFSELNKALPFILLIDLTKAGLLAQFALSSTTQKEVQENIAQGMSVLGPTCTLDTIVKTLVIGVGTLSGVKRLEEMCCFACMSAVVNYIVFMAFYPACLSLILELTRHYEGSQHLWHLSTLTRVLQQEEEQKPNPVLQRVKVIMSAGLVLVHAHSRWPILLANNSVLDQHTSALSSRNEDVLLPRDWDVSIPKLFSVSAEQMVILVLAFALAIKFLFFESREENPTEHLQVPSGSPQPYCPTKGLYQSKTVQTMSVIQKTSSLREEHPVVKPSCRLPVCLSTQNQKSKIQSKVCFIIGGDAVVKDSVVEKEVQTDELRCISTAMRTNPKLRPFEDCVKLFNSEDGLKELADDELVLLCEKKVIPTYKLESLIGNSKKGVMIRRKFVSKSSGNTSSLDQLPFLDYDYSLVLGSCCENVVGYAPIPVGCAGPLLLDNETIHIPMATTEKGIITSMEAGCLALMLSGGAKSCLYRDEMTRAPVVAFPSAGEAVKCKQWLQKSENFDNLKAAFDSTSRFARLKHIKAVVAGRYVFLRFAAGTGDAMGMNMVSKGCEKALLKLKEVFPLMEVISVSGNFCTDKKPAAVNWTEGRGKTVFCETVISSQVIKKVFQTSASAIANLHTQNLIHCATAGTIGGYSCRAADIVTAIFLATGQDPAQNVTSANCITEVKLVGAKKDDLFIRCTMPSIEVGTIGGGTVLPAQAACLKLIGVQGPNSSDPGKNAVKLAKVLCAAVLAGELSHMAKYQSKHPHVKLKESAEHPFSMLSRLFYRHGKFCASHPWEVIVAFLTLTICMVSMGTTVIGSNKICGYKCLEENKGVEMVLMTIMRCIAVLYGYQQFRKLYKLGSTYLVGIAGLFTAFSSFVFCTSVTNFLYGDFSELNKALPFFCLLIDLTKAGLLAQFALSSSTQDEVRENIAQGMSVIGPTITLDTVVETLVIGVGTLSGVKRLEEMCCFACMSAVVNYLVFMAFFPACLSLILELSRDQDEGRPLWHLSTLTRVLQQEEEQKPNPVLQRVKVIMSAGLVLVHAHSRWPILIANNSVMDHHSTNLSPPADKIEPFQPEHYDWDISLQKWFAVSAEQMVILVLTCALAVKYLFFESRDELTEQLASAAMSSPSRCITGNKRILMSRTVQTLPLTESYSSLAQEQSLRESTPNGSPTPAFRSTQSVSFTLGEDDSAEDHKMFLEKAVQTEEQLPALQKGSYLVAEASGSSEPRSVDECRELLKLETGGEQLTDEELVLLCEKKIVPSYKLETVLGDHERGVRVRRKFVLKSSLRPNALDGLPFSNYDYSLVLGSCCENVIGYVPIPVGIAGPLLLDGELLYIPMATTEGCLVASTNRGCRALTLSGGVRSYLQNDEMTRAPVIGFSTTEEATKVREWLQIEENFQSLKKVFDSTSRFARLKKIDNICVTGCYVYLRFAARTGDAMGMNMVSKGCEKALFKLKEVFPSMEIVSVSGNYCTDKKPAAINWIQGRGKSVVCEAQIPAHIVKQVLKTDAASVVRLNVVKNLIGSAMAGSIGGFNAQAANIVTAIYLATGQDPAQNVTSSNCITQLEAVGPDKNDLTITCTMPSLELGTVGGGTILPAQSACLKLLGVQGPCTENPGQNAIKLARIVCATVVAGELSLLSALAEGQLVHSHMTHNRSAVSIPSDTRTEQHSSN